MVKEKLIGFVFGLTATLAGIIFYNNFFSRINFIQYEIPLYSKKLGAIISIGSLINIPLFLFY